ncbi:MAG: methyl-accepting chemotaxis protein, partial [Paucibacter sp.]|nr:methyl-accepting chemotaxis protein [Roseateles sp.]
GSAPLALAAVHDADLRDKIGALKTEFEQYQKLVSALLDKVDKFSAAKGAEQLIFNDNEGLRQRLSAVQQAYREEQDSLGITFWLMVLGGMMTLVTAAAIGRVLLQDSNNRTRGAERRRREADAMRQQAQKQEEEAKSMNEQNQAAILRLMNELQEVADGDLTIQATVSEDITGAIADSVNYTVEELRGLVGRVTATAEQVTRASTHAQSISSDLLLASQQQSREIQDASSTVVKMANEITDVSRSASESADVARQSVAAAQQGAQAVDNAIKGMHEIREQIQDTSKRIKRLGESSQEIGEITELISDITEQTNVLALNAAIQAASAGEAGRGFSVVAEEVQRLAERSAEAAKQIGALVRAIQTDTHDAVAAMEKSTQGVVEGARLSDAAGAALHDISQVSNRLAELISGISYATGMQASSASGVAQNIQHILTVTQQTQDGTQQTTQSIHKLSVLAQELKNSVARFRISS